MTAYNQALADTWALARKATILHVFELISGLQAKSRTPAFDALSKELESIARVLVIAHREIELLREKLVRLEKAS